jgi:chromosome segregation ATPase
MSILHKALETLEADFITLATTAEVKTLLREAIAQIEGFREDCHRMRCAMSDQEYFDASELLDILAGEEEAPTPAAPEIIEPTPEMQVTILASALATREVEAAAAKVTAREATAARRVAEDTLDEARQEEETAKEELERLEVEVEQLENTLSLAKKAMIH